MKTPHDPRHLKRIKVMQELYSYSFHNQKPQGPDAKEIISALSQIDELISKAAPAWPLEKINKIDLAVLRLAAYELLHHKDTPPKVVIDEAVEIGKEYGSESSSSFINGVLGKLVSLQGMEV